MTAGVWIFSFLIVGRGAVIQLKMRQHSTKRDARVRKSPDLAPPFNVQLNMAVILLYGVTDTP